MTTLILALGFLTGFFWQDASLERKAIISFQQATAATFDVNLPERSLVSWFNQTVGPQAGIHWQITDCSEWAEKQNDPPICVEAVAILPNQRKAMMVATVGTHNNGVSGKPRLNFIVVEHNGDFYKVNRLAELKNMLTRPLRPRPKPIALPAVKVKSPSLMVLSPVRLFSRLVEVKMPDIGKESGIPPPLQGKEGSRRMATEITLGETITRVTPAYPIGARQVGASGEVKVQILVSEVGRVVEAVSISGHPLLRSSAETAAKKWVFKPVLMDGKPVKVQGTLTFVFTRP